MSIENIRTAQANYSVTDERAERSDRAEPPANGELMTPANYAVVGGTFELLMLMLEANKAAKDTARTESTAAALGAEAAKEEQVDALRAQANATFAGAIFSAGASAASAATSMSGSLRANHVNNAAENLGPAAQAKAAEQAKAISDQSAGYAKLSEATGALQQALAGHIASGHGIDATRAEARAAALQQSAQQLRSELDELGGQADKLIAYARDIEAARNRCTQIAIQAR